jgi:hypothetical protein
MQRIEKSQMLHFWLLHELTLRVFTYLSDITDITDITGIQWLFRKQSINKCFMLKYP